MLELKATGILVRVKWCKRLAVGQQLLSFPCGVVAEILMWWFALRVYLVTRP